VRGTHAPARPARLNVLRLAPITGEGTMAHAAARSRRTVSVRIGTALFSGGAASCLLGLALPHPAEANEQGWIGMGAVLSLLALALWFRPPREGDDAWLPPATLLVAIATVTCSVYFTGEVHGGEPLLVELYYVWCGLYAGFFFSGRRLAAGVLLMAAAYLTVLILIGKDGGTLAMRGLVTVSVVAGTAAAAHAVRRHVDRLVEQLRTLARTDPLTGVLNRRALHERLVAELQRSRRTGQPLSVLAGDVDRFKALNDRYGHPAGDAALAAIAARLSEASRSIDVVARAGGEEFAVVLPATGALSAFHVAERLRAAVAHERRPDGEPLTISFGVVTTERASESPEDLLAAADVALYEAKAAGRDRTVAYGDGSVTA